MSTNPSDILRKRNWTIGKVGSDVLIQCENADDARAVFDWLTEFSPLAEKDVVVPMRLEEAWLHVKALWPNADCILKKDDMLLADVVKRGDSFGQAVSLPFTNIVWPYGVTRYPESA